MKMKPIKILTNFGLSTLPLIIIISPFTVMNLFEAENTFNMETVTDDIKLILYHVQRCLDILHSQSHTKYLVLVQQIILGEMLRQLNLGKGQLSVVMYPINRLLYIIQPVLNQSGIQTIIRIVLKVSIIQGVYEMMTVVPLTNSQKNGVLTQ